MPFSERSGVDRDKNALSVAVEAYRRAERPLLDLTSGNPTESHISYDAERLTRALSDRRWLRYEPDPRGALSAREAICETWTELGVTVSPERVFVTASTSEAYGYLFKLLCDPGDQILIPAPSYPLFEHLARLEGVEPVPYPLAFDGGWHIDRSCLEKLVGPRVRAMVIVNPNNPTGHFIKSDELDGLTRLGLPIISDEVFNAYGVDVPRRAERTALAHPDATVFALSGLSKLAGLPQAKLAWITVHGPPAVAHEALGRLELIADTYLSPSAPVLLGLPELLAATSSVRSQIQERVVANVRSLRERLAASAMTLLPIEGGWYGVLRLPRTRPEEEWVLSLLSEHGVLVQPGYFFDFSDEPYAVISLITPRSIFDEGTARILEHVATSTG